MVERLAALASMLVRHAGAYTELLLTDIDATRSLLHQRVLLGMVLATASVLAVAMGCVGIIALTWDTAARLWAIAGLLVVFLGVAVLAFRKLSALRAGEPPLLSQTLREWEKDRRLLEDLLARERGQPS